MGIGRLTAGKLNRGTFPPGRYPDGGGLYLQVSPTGVKAWVLRFVSPVQRTAQGRGRPREMGLGPLELVGLADARQAAIAARKLVHAGVDPIDERDRQRAAARAQAVRGISFQACAEAYITAHEPTWRNVKHRQQWRNTLATYAYPEIGPLGAQDVDRAAVLRVVEPIWHAKPETASRVRGRIETILDWAIAKGHREGPNPAIWKGGLASLLPARGKVRKVRHQPAMAYRDLPGFMVKLRALGGAGPLALEFVILTVGRSGEIRGAAWSELDTGDDTAETWTVPPDRIKGGREHRVPLTDPARAVLRRMTPERDRRRGDFIFPGGRRGRPLSENAFGAVLERLGYGHVTAHGFRSTFRDWAGEQTAFAREVAEACLAHQIGDAVERAYARGDLLEKRRRLMTAWAHYCGSAPAAGNVVGIGAHR